MWQNAGLWVLAWFTTCKPGKSGWMSILQVSVLIYQWMCVSVVICVFADQLGRHFYKESIIVIYISGHIANSRSDKCCSVCVLCVCVCAGEFLKVKSRQPWQSTERQLVYINWCFNHCESCDLCSPILMGYWV